LQKLVQRMQPVLACTAFDVPASIGRFSSCTRCAAVICPQAESDSECDASETGQEKRHTFGQKAQYVYA
jgi:hypothetical protein